MLRIKLDDELYWNHFNHCCSFVPDHFSDHILLLQKKKASISSTKHDKHNGYARSIPNYRRNCLQYRFYRMQHLSTTSQTLFKIIILLYSFTFTEAFYWFLVLCKAYLKTIIQEGTKSTEECKCLTVKNCIQDSRQPTFVILNYYFVRYKLDFITDRLDFIR